MIGDPREDWTGPPQSEAGSLLTIDLGALADNWRILRDRARGAECAAVVKADAYGIGLEPAVSALRRAGCRTFFVAHLHEAARLRALAADVTVYVFNGLLPGADAAHVRLNARPVLGSLEEIRDWSGAGAPVPAALHVDTGMNRHGLTVADAAAVSGRLPFRPALVMSHFASSEDPTNPSNAAQAAAFSEVRQAFPDIPASLANSSGIFLDQPPLDVVRPGYALYGGNPTPGRSNPMREVVRLDARVVQVRDVEPGASVGYNGCWTAPGQRRLATLSIGYADGYLRSASGTDAKLGLSHPAGAAPRAGAAPPAAAALVAGRLCPLVGRISMDLIVVDITEVPGGAAVRGDFATLIGDELGLDEVGRRAGTIGYEILTQLGRRHARRYLGGA